MSLKLDKCVINDQVLSRVRNPKKVFRAWKEGWEKVETEKQDAVIAARLARKNGGIQWLDLDNENRIVACHSTKIHWKRERKRRDNTNHTGCCVLATSSGNDADESDPEEQEDACWYFLERNVEFYTLVVACYKANPNVDASVD